MSDLRVVEDGAVSGRLHRCSICGKTEPWGPAWEWYGTLDDEDNPDKIKTCSAGCRAEHRRLGMPANQTALDRMRPTRKRKRRAPSGEDGET